MGPKFIHFYGSLNCKQITSEENFENAYFREGDEVEEKMTWVMYLNSNVMVGDE